MTQSGEKIETGDHMKESVKNHLIKLHQLTNASCRKCPQSYSCCERDFCLAVESGLSAIGTTIQRTTHPTLPFMGPSGCVVPPELRPGCSGYVCTATLKSNRKLRREWAHLHTKIVGDETVAKLMDAANSYLKKVRP